MSGTRAGRLAILAAVSGLTLAGCASRGSPSTATGGASHRSPAAVDCHALATSPQSNPTKVPQPGSSAESGRLDPAAQAIDALDRGWFKTSYTGLALATGQHSLVVYRKPQPEFDLAARNSAGNMPVVFCDTTRAKAELDPLAARIASENSQGQHGFTVYTVSATLEGYLQVGADKPDIARPYLKNTYGPTVGGVVQGQPSTNQ